MSRWAGGTVARRVLLVNLMIAKTVAAGWPS